MNTTTSRYTETKFNVDTRYIVKCKCGSIARVETVKSYRRTECDRWMAPKTVMTGELLPTGEWFNAPKCKCGRHPDLVLVKGTKTAHVCGAKCTNSRSGICNCSCGGKNHGIGHAAA